MAVDSGDVGIKTNPCFCKVITPLLLLLLSVGIVDVILRANRLTDSAPSQKYCFPRPLLTGVNFC